MSARTRFAELPEDVPVPLLTRRRVQGDRILVAFVRLAKGCHVALHRHESEQVAIITSGRVRWTVGEAGSPEHEVFEAAAGDVVVLRSNVPHEVDALEDTEITDVLSPVAPMGVDSQRG